MDALIDVVGLGFEEVNWVVLDVLESLQVLVERHVGLPDESVALHLAEDEVSDFVVDHPMLLLINIVLVDDLLLYISVYLCEVDDVIVDLREILVFEGVDGLPDAVFVRDEVPFFEVDVLLYYVLQRNQDVLLDLQRNNKDVRLDVVHNALVVRH